MATVDWIFLGVLLFSLVVGAWRGLVYELISLASWFAAFVLAQWLAGAGGAHRAGAGSAAAHRWRRLGVA